MKNVKKIANEIFAKKIGDIHKRVEINLDNLELALSHHGKKRLYRDKSGEPIAESEVLQVVKKGIDEVIDDFANGEIPNDAEVLIKKEELNIVGRLTMRKGLDSFVVITVMRKRDFKPKSGTYTYII